MKMEMKNINKIFILTIMFILNVANVFGNVNTEIYNYVKTIPSTYTLDEVTSTITKKSTTTLEKVQAINYWIDLNISYDYDLTKYDEAHTAKESSILRDVTDTYTSVFNKKKGVCSGISNLFRYIAFSNGLTTYVIRGQAILPINGGTHAWNAVRDGSSYIFVDATWGEDNTTYDYIELSKKNI